MISAVRPAVNPPLYRINPPCILDVTVHIVALSIPAITPYLKPYFPAIGQRPVANAIPRMYACVESVHGTESPDAKHIITTIS